MARFLCRITDDMHLVPVYAGERLRRWRGKECWAEIHRDPAPRIRSSSSNRFLWAGIYGAIAAETGNDPETVHLALKREAVRVGVLEPLYVLLGDKLFEEEPSTVVGQEQFTAYVSWIRAGCATGSLLGTVVVLPESGE